MQYINDNGEVYDGGSIVIGDMRYISPSEEIILQAGYHIVEDPLPDPLDAAKTIKLDDIAIYDQSENVNVFYLAGQPMWLDAQTRQQLRISIEAYQAIGAENVTKWFNGNQFTFPTQAWLQMLNALEVYAAEALNVTEAHIAAVKAMNNLEDVINYDITSGYPEKLNLSTEWVLQQSQA